ncbi:hypothetical protein CHS0354_004677 [Potamilus streckersoni]|uniref:SWI/SNF-related matrix-associated actin-dependent regulator of chromatin subfamily A-like protein 1 n=1 Tax=Potamilus streckersoni TaxID=2493646 RepID=A0AAE0VS00_9BIVA|nr:hypothetical protein CHS0354_004677 [Potamilus streckersoni]
MSSNLSEEQKRKIEENRQKALAKRAEKQQLIPAIDKGQNFQIQGFSQLKSATTYGISQRQSSGNSVEQSSISKEPGSINSPQGQLNGAVSNFYTKSEKPYNKGVNSYTNSQYGANKSVIVSNPKVTEIHMGQSLCQSSSNQQTSGSSGQFFKKGIFGTTVKGTCVLIAKDRFEVNIGYFAPLIEVFKSIKSKLYDAVTKKWTFRLEDYNKLCELVKPLQPHVQIDPLPPAILKVFGENAREDKQIHDIPTADLSNVDKILVNSLFPFQREGVNFGVHKKGRVLIADDMGLGKTIQAICMACYYRSDWPLLVVVPSSVRFDWAQQFQRWVPSLDPQEISVAVTGKDSCTSTLVNIVSYDLMVKKAQELQSKHFQIIIMDECHSLKNFKTARCKAALPLLQKSRRVILLSGTPALSRPSELYTQIAAVCPSLFKYHDFGMRYCDGKKTPWGWDYTGSSNMEELQLLLEEKVMIRRMKKDVLTQLPDKCRQMVLLDPSSLKIDKELKNAGKIMKSKYLKGMEQRGALLSYFHETSKAKLSAVRDYVLDLLEGEKKFLVFAHHQEMLDALEDAIKEKIESNYIRIDGRTNAEQRNFFCHKFQSKDSIRVAILSITAANAGLNLSASSLVVFAELFWNPGILVQAEDRAHRIGQHDCVNVHYLVAQGTADDYIWPLVQKKLDVLSKAGLTKDDFSEADTTRLKDAKQLDIAKMFEQSFFEYDNITETETVDAEIAAKFNSNEDEAGKSSDSHSKGGQSTLFHYFSPKKDQKQSATETIKDQGHSSSNDDLDLFMSDINWEEDVDEPLCKKQKV